ncbi:MAG: tetratricopeptide repeat protein [Desulfobacca sp.]|nr:tetratricopeptide repeat protein [Desulfobacca sp.]
MGAHRGLIMVLLALVWWLAGGSWGPGAAVASSSRANNVNKPRRAVNQPAATVQDKSGPETSTSKSAAPFQNQTTIATNEGRELLSLEPQDLLHSAREQAHQGQLEQSGQSLLRFINLFPAHPQYGQAFLELGKVQSRLGQREVAIQCYQLATQFSSQPQVVGGARFHLYTLDFYRQLEQGDPLKAFQHYLTRVVNLRELDQGTAGAREELQSTLARAWEAITPSLAESFADNPQAIEDVLKLWEQHPVAWRPWPVALFLGKLLHSKGLNTAAQEFLESVLELGHGPQRQEARRYLADIYWEQRDFARLEKSLQQWQQEGGPLSPECLARLGWAQLATGRPSEAVESLQKALQLAQVAQCPEYWSALAQACQQSGHQWPENLAWQEVLGQNLPTAATAKLRQQLARYYLLQGDYGQAAQLYQQLTDGQTNNPATPVGTALEALCHLKAGQFPQAQQAFQALAQSNEHLWQELARIHLQGLNRQVAKSYKNF